MDKQTSAILRLQDAAEMSERIYQKPLVLTYSGGKDSDVLIHLADAAGIDYEVQHSLTTADAPETVYYIKDVLHQLEDNGIKCTIDIHRQPRLGGGLHNVESYPPHVNATHGYCKILLRPFKRNRREASVSYYGCQAC